MEKNYKEAFSEVSSILKLMPEEISSKIPNSFKMAIEENKSSSYVKKITEPLEEQNLRPETIVILGMIYKDFLHDKFLNTSSINEKEIAQEQLEKISKKDNTNEVKDLAKIKKDKWYQKIIKLLKSIFR